MLPLALPSGDPGCDGEDCRAFERRDTLRDADPGVCAMPSTSKVGELRLVTNPKCSEPIKLRPVTDSGADVWCGGKGRRGGHLSGLSFRGGGGKPLEEADLNEPLEEA